LSRGAAHSPHARDPIVSFHRCRPRASLLSPLAVTTRGGPVYDVLLLLRSGHIPASFFCLLTLPSRWRFTVTRVCDRECIAGLPTPSPYTSKEEMAFALPLCPDATLTRPVWTGKEMPSLGHVSQPSPLSHSLQSLGARYPQAVQSTGLPQTLSHSLPPFLLPDCRRPFRTPHPACAPSKERLALEASPPSLTILKVQRSSSRTFA